MELIRRRIFETQPRRVDVVWNQKALPLTSMYRKVWNAEYVSATFADDTATITWLRAGVYGYSCTMSHANSSYTPYGHALDIMYLAYDLKASWAAPWSAEVRGQILQPTIQSVAGEWVRFSARFSIPSGSASQSLRELYPDLRANTAQAGSTAIVRNELYVNLTEMYGAGNEPATAAEFERELKLNGIRTDQTIPFNATGTPMKWWR